MRKPKAGRPEKPPVDWQEMHRRLEAARERLARGWSPPPGERQRLLAARARALAQEAAPPKAGHEIEMVELLLDRERYGVESPLVNEVVPLREHTPIPCTPAFVLGIVNIRGRIVSLLDLKKFFGLPEKGLADRNRVVVLRGEGMEFGLLADAVLGTRRLLLEELQPGLPTLTGVRGEYLKGIAADGAILLDARKMLTDRAMVVREEVG
ncbi:MAG: chemotaxis protein CheW [Desulfobacteraceae bacterium]|nr:chemotaxis protein CheW [Desulfobacteraceae bacterium]